MLERREVQGGTDGLQLGLSGFSFRLAGMSEAGFSETPAAANRAARWLLGVFAFLMTVGAVAWYCVRGGESSWREYRAAREAEGERFEVAPWLPPEVPEERNFAAHPWVSGLIASRTSVQSSAVKEIVSAIPGEYERPDGAVLWFAGHPEETRRFLDRIRSASGDFAALHEAADRPDCRMPAPVLEGFDAGMGDFSPVSMAMEMHAEASLVSGDVAASVRDLETMLRIGGHLQGQRRLLLLVVACGFERKAMPLIEAGLDKGLFSPGDKRRLLAACRTRTLERELPLAMRCERAMTIATFTRLGAVRRTGIRDWFKRSPENVAADACLLYCRELQPALADPSRAAWRKLAEDSGRKSGTKEPAGMLAYSALSGTVSLAEPLFDHDAEFAALRERLAK